MDGEKNSEDRESPGDRPRVGLFATCLVDALRPTVGFAAARLLEDAGCIVSVPERQVCCGQPAWNGGDRQNAVALAKQTVAQFDPVDYVVVPSGSCAAMLRVHYPVLLAGDPSWAARADSLAARSWELTAFLSDVMKVSTLGAQFDGKVTYHDSCSGLRELGVRDQPRRLLAMVGGLSLEEDPDSERCCGFGGTFCVKYDEIAAAMTDARIDAIRATEAGTVLAGDLGCLMALAGRMSRRGDAVAARHVAEVLAGMTDGPPIGGGDTG